MLFRGIVLIAIFSLSIQQLFCQATDLIISEYGEGTSGNSKYIEIYNGTGNSVNLVSYDLCLVSNGGSWCESTYTFTTGSIADGATLVIANNTTDVPGADEYSGTISWNGDDAVALRKSAAILDLIGNEGADPGTGWDVAGTTNATANQKLTRKSSICSPNNDWDNSRGTNTTNSEWVVSAYTTGSATAGHTASCGSCTADSEPTTPSNTFAFSNIGCAGMDISWTSGNGANRIVVASTSAISGSPTDQTDYSASATFGIGSTIAANEYVVYNGNGNSFTLSGLNASTTYHFAIFEYNGTNANCTENYLTSSSLTGNETSIACVDPQVTGILADACGGSEGIDELFTFRNGNSSLNINDIQADFPSGGSYCNSGCATRTWVTNATYVAQLNTTAGCAGLFVEADPIPAGANVIVFTGASPSYNFDFSALCSTGPYYAMFANNASTTGRFGNYNGDCTQYRTLTVHFGGGYSDSGTYQRCAMSNIDGDYIGFADDGTASYYNDGCTPVGILPIVLSSFIGKPSANGNLLKWTTLSETNNDYFTIEKSENGVDFYEIGNIIGAGTSNIENTYSFVDDSNMRNILYYRLKQTDFDGKFSYSEIIAIYREINTVTYNHSTRSLLTNDFEGAISIFSLEGKLLGTYSSKPMIPLNLKNGIYIVKSFSQNNQYSSKFIVNH